MMSSLAGKEEYLGIVTIANIINQSSTPNFFMRVARAHVRNSTGGNATANIAQVTPSTKGDLFGIEAIAFSPLYWSGVKI
jgi:hypothetical protein